MIKSGIVRFGQKSTRNIRFFLPADYTVNIEYFRKSIGMQVEQLFFLYYNLSA